MLSDSYSCLSAPFGFPFNEIKADHTFGDGDVLNLCGMTFKVIFTPGHTTGSVCFLVEDILFSGDTLFSGSIGRTDFPGGDYGTIINSLNRILTYDAEYSILSGHGDITDVATEKR